MFAVTLDRVTAATSATTWVTAFFSSSSLVVSLSVTVTATEPPSVTSPYPVTAWARVTLSLTASSSSLALTVTVCGVFQLAAVKVRVAGEAVTAFGLLLVGVTVTSPAGAVFRLTE